MSLISDDTLASGDMRLLNDLLYEASRQVVATWEKGDLAAAVRDLERVLKAIDRAYVVDLTLGVD